MTDRENLCIANTAAGRTPTKKGSRRGRYRKTADGRKNYVPRRLMRWMWLWTFRRYANLTSETIYARRIPTGFCRADMSLLFTESNWRIHWPHQGRYCKLDSALIRYTRRLFETFSHGCFANIQFTQVWSYLILKFSVTIDRASNHSSV